jgi:hypothetical protein
LGLCLGLVWLGLCLGLVGSMSWFGWASISRFGWVSV